MTDQPLAEIAENVVYAFPPIHPDTGELIGEGSYELLIYGRVAIDAARAKSMTNEELLHVAEMEFRGVTRDWAASANHYAAGMVLGIMRRRDRT